MSGGNSQIAHSLFPISETRRPVKSQNGISSLLTFCTEIPSFKHLHVGLPLANLAVREDFSPHFDCVYSGGGNRCRASADHWAEL